MSSSPAVVNFAEAPHSVELRDLEPPEIGAEDVLLAVEAVGVCGSDLHQWTSQHSWPVNYPVVLGHEFGGIIVTGGNNFTDQMLAHEGGFMMGVQATLFDRLVFDFNFGGGFRHVQTATDNPFGNRLEEDVFASPARTGVSPRIGFQIGVAF